MTLGAPKVPLVLPPAEHVAGDVVIADIGIPLEAVDEARGAAAHLLTRDSVRALVHPRGPDAHKGDCGRVLIVAGSRGKTGAAVLAARGALASGAGWSRWRRRRACQPDRGGARRGVHDRGARRRRRRHVRPPGPWTRC